MFDPQLRYMMNLVRDNSERAVIAKRFAEMAAHLATLASNAAIVKAHQAVHDVYDQTPPPELPSEAAQIEDQATALCKAADRCKPNAKDAKEAMRNALLASANET